jgi:predicted ATP-binding protein involved in virulence
MRLNYVHIRNFRAISDLQLPLHPSLTVLHGENAQGKTSALGAIAVGLSRILKLMDVKKVEAYQPEDIRNGAECAEIELETIDGVRWRELGWRTKTRKSSLNHATRAFIDLDDHRDLRSYLRSKGPDAGYGERVVVASYDTERAVFWAPQRKRDFKTEFTYMDAYEDALEIKPSFKKFFEWFDRKESDELRLQRDANDKEVQVPELNAVRAAIQEMLSGVSDLHMDVNPLRFTVRLERPGGGFERLSLDQLSGGYRIMLAMVGDLALRMAMANPQLRNPLSTEAIVLIDEVELHLHPSWQQRVLSDLTRTFPNTQFIVSTHSPQVLTTVKPEHIVRLRSTGKNVVAEREIAPTYGNEAGDVLYTVMGVSERPPIPYTDMLRRYRELVAQDQGETAEAKALRREAQALSPDDPAWDALDIEIRRRNAMREYANRK